MAEIWDIRPRAEVGDKTPLELYSAVGQGMTLWEILESSLAELFDVMTASKNRAGFRAFQSGRTVSARIKMMRSATPVDGTPTSLTDSVSQLIDKVEAFSHRRHELAHGHVADFDKHGHYLVPNNTSPRHWTHTGAARFQYTAEDLNYYLRHFERLIVETRTLTKIVKAVLIASSNSAAPAV